MSSLRVNYAGAGRYPSDSRNHCSEPDSRQIPRQVHIIDNLISDGKQVRIGQVWSLVTTALARLTSGPNQFGAGPIVEQAMLGNPPRAGV